MMRKLLGGADSLWRLYAFSALTTIIACAIVGVSLGLTALLTVTILCVLEITFSFDNAIINAKILSSMSSFWRGMFMTVGLLFAVFGMRLVLPILLVVLTTGLDISSVVHLAILNPSEYASRLNQTHDVIAAFGGMFLLMVFIEFMVNDKRDIHWLGVIERPLIRMGQLEQVPIIASLVVLVIATELFAGGNGRIVLAGILGILTNLIIRVLISNFERRQLDGDEKAKLVKGGLVSFIYLEVLDASFSFDSVIGAFAITKLIILIAIGLGIGALWVRSMTVHLVARDTLRKFRYLDHGAHYAIGALACIMLISIGYEIPDFVTGLTGAAIIGLALLSSWHYNRRSLAA